MATGIASQRDAQQAMAGERLVMAGQVRAALPIFKDLATRNPDHVGVLYMLGLCQVAVARREEGARNLERAIAIGPASAPMYHNLALAYRGMSKFDLAHKTQDEVIRRWPDEPAGPAGKADLYHFTGEVDKALEVLEPALVKFGGDVTIALAFGRLAADAGQAERGVELLLPHAQRSDLAPGIRAQVLFRLGPLLEKVKRYDEAWAVATEANRLKREPFNIPEHAAQIDRMIAAWTPERIASVKAARSSSEVPVFIVGFPRSGTSLVEQIIASHPKAAGGGERPDIHDIVKETCGTWYMEAPEALPKGAFDRMGERYLRDLRRVDARAARITDKAPMNWRCLGPISLMFPRARVIHCLRSPIDTCLSCYFLTFDGAMPFKYDLSTLGAMYRDYRRMFEHWKRVLGIPVLEVRYEEMVAEPEENIRRIIDFTGLPWDEACLKFHESERVVTTASNAQVRKPVYTSSVARWKNYEKHLGPLIAALGPWARESM